MWLWLNRSIPSRTFDKSAWIPSNPLDSFFQYKVLSSSMKCSVAVRPLPMCTMRNTPFHRFSQSPFHIQLQGVACLLRIFLQYLIELFFSFNEDSSRFTTLKWFNKTSILKLINNSSSPGIAKTESAL